MRDNAKIEFELSSDINVESENFAAAIKCIFNTPQNFTGAFCILLRRHDLKVIEFVLWTTKFTQDDVMELNLSMTWENFLKKIPSMGPMDNESCLKLKQALKDKLSEEMIGSVLDNPQSNTIPFGSEIRELFESKLHYTLELDLIIEEFSRERLKNSGYEREEVDSDINAESISMLKIMSEHPDSQVIFCTAFVDPLNGIAVSKLKEGDLLEVGLPINNTIGAILSDFYAKSNKIPTFPVKKVSVSDTGSFVIELEGDGGIPCIVKTTSDLRLRGKKGETYENSVSVSSFVIMIGFGITLITLAIVILVMLLMR